VLGRDAGWPDCPSLGLEQAAASVTHSGPANSSRSNIDNWKSLFAPFSGAEHLWQDGSFQP
jgi:hypothetical protein